MSQCDGTDLREAFCLLRSKSVNFADRKFAQGDHGRPRELTPMSPMFVKLSYRSLGPPH